MNLQSLRMQGAGASIFSAANVDGGALAVINSLRGRADRRPALERFIDRMAQGVAAGGDRNDAPNIPVWAQELEHLYSEVYMIEYNDLPMANGDILPLDTEVPNYVEIWKYRTLQAAGGAKIMNSTAVGSAPRVSLGGKEYIGHVASVMNAFGYSLQDMRVMAAVNSSLTSMYPEAARRAHEEIQDRVAWWGDKEHDLTGLLTHPNVPVQYAPLGADNSTKWEDKTFDEVFADFVYLASASKNRTFGREVATLIMLPRDVEEIMITKRIPNDKQTLRAHIAENYPGLTVKFVDQLNAGHPDNPNGFGYGVAIKIDKSASSLVTPQAFEMLDPSWQGHEWVTYCHSRIGGVKIPKPYSISIMPGIS